MKEVPWTKRWAQKLSEKQHCEKAEEGKIPESKWETGRLPKPATVMYGSRK